MAPFSMYRVFPLVVSLAAIWPLARWFGDYKVMLYAMLIQYVISVAVSHLMARRSYAVSFDTAVIRRALAFGWPLLVNNMLLFGVMQGDRVIVARELGLETLAIFSMGVTLAMTPTLVLARSMSLFFLPRLSAAQDKPERFAHLGRASLQASLMAGILLVLAIILLGEPLVRIVLGQKFAALVPILAWFGIWQAMRAFRIGCAITAVAGGRTKLQMIANTARLVSLPVAWFAAANGAPPVAVVWIATAGEFGAYLVALLLLRHWFVLDFRQMILPFLLTALFVAVAVAWTILQPMLPALYIPGLVALAAIALAALFAMRDIRKYLFPSRRQKA